MAIAHRSPAGRRGRPVVVAIVAVALVASACGGRKAGEKQSADPLGGRGESGLSGAGKPVRGGNLVYGLEADTAGGFCLPEGQLAISGMMVVRAIYDTLTVPNSKGDYSPYLAKSVTHNANYTTWDITLRSGVLFHDGTKLDGKVVKNNLDAYRGKYPGRASLLAGFTLSNISSVTITGPFVVEVKTKVPWAAFPAYLYGGSRFGIMAQAQLDDKKTCDRKLIGTGPFVFKSWQPNTKFDAVRNPHYWQIAPDGKPYPYADSIEFRPIPESQQRVNGLQAGTLNVIHTSSTNDISGPLRSLRNKKAINMMVSQDHAEVGYLLLNASQPPFDDVRMRRAFAMAIDRTEVNNILANGLPTVANGPFAPGNVGYLKDPGFPKHDTLAAKRLVSQYVKEGHKATVTLTLLADPAIERLGALLQQQVAKAGITLRPSSSEQAQLINTAIGGKFQALTFRNHPGGDPDTQYVWWYDGNPDPKVSTNPVNFGRINDPVMDKLLDTGRSEIDPAKRQRIYQDVNRRFAKQVWNVWLSYTAWAIAENSKVHGILGPDLPDGSKPFTGLATGHPVLGMWIDK
ncbi:MAG: ABC transporter substrate-binding protein [Actinomycetota bacterium]|nr:ABC transporter substrate-binding protein [Actinomycetota bacterium]